MSAASVWSRYVKPQQATQIAPTEPFNLLRWFSLISFIIISVVAFGLGTISTRFLVNESLERDAMLSAQFIQSVAQGEIRHHGLTGMQIGDVLAAAQYAMLTDETTQNRHRARSEFLDHLTHLPDSLLTTIYSPARVVVWSTNRQLVGKRITDDEALEEAFNSRGQVFAKYSEVEEGRSEQQFLRAPSMFFIENYIPLMDDQGNVLAMVEIYKEPVDLIERVNRGYRIIWLATAIGGFLIYFALYWIVRRASALLASQQNQLVANKTYVGLVEMSTAVAHSLRNPLASIRSSAELAQVVLGQPAQQYNADIISQVDRMSGWVRDLLLCLRPLRGESEQIEPMAAVHDALNGFDQQLSRSNIQVEVIDEPTPRVVSHQLLLAQVLNSVIANAIEAMPDGGRLVIQAQLDESRQWLQLTLDDTGMGMSRQQEMMAFKSFYTTKHGGLGIGLTMVKQIMERFGGTVSLTSREQKGTRVCLSFKVVGQGDNAT
ncbi:HAMP domain-containing histidine kinase [Pseudomonas sp. LS1212]|uniref:sensor histidine kinase n=1 Tax=Pseudomonas sp. LS1212 TaxID=2972478 RepID=UPI00215C6BED|nr:HAMP domain-containing sensor histidine kinase [Pseudomonas sp. LS1212]UVJ42037.1 HAMP domain-containing histidine kinase [Pseudomonas sp. LS1212]